MTPPVLLQSVRDLMKGGVPTSSVIDHPCLTLPQLVQDLERHTP